MPQGVAARESLRTEAGYLLNGNDMDAKTNPFEAGLGWGWQPRALYPLKSVKAPWSASVAWAPGLREQAGRWSEVTGVFNMTLRLDPSLRDEPEFLQRFVIAHEVQHLVGHHGFWALLSLLCPPLIPLVRRQQEAIADRAAKARMRPLDVARSMAMEHRDYKRWWPRLVHAWLYGHPRARLARVGIAVE